MVDGRFVIESVDFEQVFDGGVGLVEPELVEVEDCREVTRAVICAREPDGVTFRFPEFSACDRVDDEWSRPDVGLGVF